MSYPYKLIQKVIELRDNGYKWNEIETKLPVIFKKRVHFPTERTMRKWVNTWSVKEIQDIPAKLKEHFDNMGNFTAALLAGGLDNCVIAHNQNGTRSYLLNDSSVDISESELQGRLETNIDKAAKRFPTFDVIDCLLTHIEAEPPIKNRGGIYDAIAKAPDDVLNILRALKRNKNFHGSCEVCKEWRKLI